MQGEDLVGCEAARQQRCGHRGLVAQHGRFARLRRGEEEGEVVGCVHAAAFGRHTVRGENV